jgi:flagellar basal-body rod protein FlgF
MDSGYYAALTGLMTQYDALDVAANNLANVGTTGYKAQEDFYRTYSATLGDASLGPLNLAVNNYGVLGGVSTNLQAGALQMTGNPLDLALQGPGFLVAKTPAGDRYTRNGSLRVNAMGILTTQSGDPVMGLIPKPKGKPGEGPIHIPQGTIGVGPTGIISANGVVAGQLKIVDFPKGTRDSGDRARRKTGCARSIECERHGGNGKPDSDAAPGADAAKRRFDLRQRV